MRTSKVYFWLIRCCTCKQILGIKRALKKNHLKYTDGYCLPCGLNYLKNNGSIEKTLILFEESFKENNLIRKKESQQLLEAVEKWGTVDPEIREIIGKHLKCMKKK